MRSVCMIAVAVAQACGAVSIDLARVILHSTDAEIRAVAHDGTGNIYVAGQLLGGAFQSTRPLQAHGGLFLIKLNSSGNVVFATSVGTHDVAVWIAGSTRSPDLSVTPGGSSVTEFAPNWTLAGVVAGFRADGSLWFSTYTAANALVSAVGLAGGRVVAAGMTDAPEFSLVAQPLPGQPKRGFVLGLRKGHGCH